MAYAQVSDMIQLYSEQELIEVSTPPGQPMETINVARVTRALGDASNMIDSYLSRYYVTPVANPTPMLTNACCAIARYELAATGNSHPSEQMRDGRRDALTWLKAIQNQAATLDGAIPMNAGSDWSQVRTRPAPLGNGGWW